jgi:hypothetical protein
LENNVGRDGDPAISYRDPALTKAHMTLRKVVILVAFLNIAYFGIEFLVALRIGSVSLFADSVDFLATSPPIYGGALYTARLALASAPNTYLQTKQGTGARFQFAGLTPGEVYNVGIMVNGAAGPSDWSDDSSLRVV